MRFRQIAPACTDHRRTCLPVDCTNFKWRHIMAWTTPVATDLRFGFEVTMYIATR